MDNCIFCKIANHEIPSSIIYEDDLTMAFLDLSQQTIGHTLVIPKKHFANMLEVDNKTIAYVMETVKKVADHMKQVDPSIKGFNFINNCNEIAGQSVMHLHIHILPRRNKEEFVFNLSNHDLSKEEFEELATKFRM